MLTFYQQEKLVLVPTKPGVYLMRNDVGHILYIGKAKNLRARLSSYFKSGSHDAKVTAMLAKVHDFDYFITKTENDALGLEANLIKKHKPHYNILLKDSKTFPYIKIVSADYPYLEVTRKLTKGGKYFGPYFNGIWARELLNTISDIFPLRTCSKSEFGRGVPCINSQIERCLAPCAKRVTKEDYAKIIEDVKKFLRGEKDFGARDILNAKMEKAANLEQFEIAIRYRNGIEFLDKLKERTITQVGRDLNCDVFAFATRGQIVVFSVLTIRAGKLIGIQNFSSENQKIETDSEMVASFILQYYQENIVPEQVVAQLEQEELPIEHVLGTKIIVPKVAIKKKLLEMARSNAEEYIQTSIERIRFKHEFTVGATQELGKVLGIERNIKKIECYDIAHLAGEETVGSMVVFVDGTGHKKLYRRFKIKHQQGNNDYLSMQEVLRRRLLRLNSADASFGTLPDLIVVDGGKGQLSAAMQVIQELKLDINVIALAKEEEHIFVPGSSDPIILPKRSYALRLIQRLRDEAHRFATTFHKARRGQLLG